MRILVLIWILMFLSLVFFLLINDWSLVICLVLEVWFSCWICCLMLLICVCVLVWFKLLLGLWMFKLVFSWLSLKWRCWILMWIMLLVCFVIFGFSWFSLLWWWEIVFDKVVCCCVSFGCLSLVMIWFVFIKLLMLMVIVLMMLVDLNLSLEVCWVWIFFVNVCVLNVDFEYVVLIVLIWMFCVELVVVCEFFCWDCFRFFVLIVMSIRNKRNVSGMSEWCEIVVKEC